METRLPRTNQPVQNLSPMCFLHSRFGTVGVAAVVVVASRHTLCDNSLFNKALFVGKRCPKVVIFVPMCFWTSSRGHTPHISSGFFGQTNGNLCYTLIKCEPSVQKLFTLRLPIFRSCEDTIQAKKLAAVGFALEISVILSNRFTHYSNSPSKVTYLKTACIKQ